MIKRTDHVFDTVIIDRCLATDGGIHLAQYRRRDIIKINPAHIRRSRKTTKISDHASAHGNQAILSRKSMFHKRVHDLAVNGQAFALLAFLYGHNMAFFTLLTNAFHVVCGYIYLGKEQNLPPEIQIPIRLLYGAAFHDHFISMIFYIYRDPHPILLIDCITSKSKTIPSFPHNTPAP